MKWGRVGVVVVDVVAVDHDIAAVAVVGATQ